MGSFLDMRRDTVAFVAETWRTWGDTTRFRLGPYELWMVVHPREVKHVLQERGAIYEKNTLYQNLEPILGKGLVTANGERWSAHRRLLQPMFHKRVLNGLVELVADHVDAVCAELPSDGAPFDVSPVMSRIALKTIGAVFFGDSFESEAVTRSLPFALELTHRRMYDVFKTPLWLPTPENRQYAQAVRDLDTFVQEILERRADAEPREDLVGLLCAAVASGDMTLSEARDQVATIVMAGHETTGITLTWFWYLMGQNPEVYERIQAEIAALTQPVRSLGLEVLTALPLTRRVIWETLRLYPATWWIGRAPTEEDVLDGYAVKPGQIVSVCPYLTHRHPDFWKDPERFDPDRFVEKPPRDGSYLPFAMGPRRCAGEDFAMLEMVTILASVLQTADVEVNTEARRIVGGIQLRPSSSVQVSFSGSARAR